jgi:hypothetical protein
MMVQRKQTKVSNNEEEVSVKSEMIFLEHVCEKDRVMTSTDVAIFIHEEHVCS